MARIAKFRGIIATDKGSVTRLASAFMRAGVSDASHAFHVMATRDGAWIVEAFPVVSIDSSGPTLGPVFGSVVISARDVEDMKAGRARLVVSRIESETK